jgi:hypothetical protein
MGELGMTFKVGDRIVSVRDDCDSISIGEVFIVTGVEDGINTYVEFNDKNGDGRYRRAEDYELAKPVTKPYSEWKAGDIVRRDGAYVASAKNGACYRITGIRLDGDGNDYELQHMSDHGDFRWYMAEYYKWVSAGEPAATPVKAEKTKPQADKVKNWGAWA